MQGRVIVLLFFAVLIAIFSVMNIQLVTINYFFGQKDIQLIFVILFSILIGALFMFIISSMKQLKLSRKIKALEKELSKTKEELVIKSKELEVEKEKQSIDSEDKVEDKVIENEPIDEEMKEEEKKEEKDL